MSGPEASARESSVLAARRRLSGIRSARAEVARQCLAEIAHRGNLLGPELVEQVRAPALDVDRRRRFQRRAPPAAG